MKREDHQPTLEPVKRPARSGEEMRDACGRAIAVVTALGPSSSRSADDISTAIAAARNAQVAAAFVLASATRAQDAAEAVRTSGKRGRTLIEAIEYDPAAAIELTRDAGDFELINLPFGLIETARIIAESSLDGYESVILMDAAQNHVTADHLYELCIDAQQHPDAEVIVSWIEQLRRTPCLLTRGFLEKLAEADYTRPAGKSGLRAVPRIRTRDHVFGEEKLAAPTAPVPAAEAFLEKATLSALEAVKLADGRASREEPLNNADALLVQTAGDVLRASADAFADEAAELEWADSFGRANRARFPLLNDEEHARRLAYLDTAATSQRVDAALQAQRTFDEHANANVYRGAYELSGRATIAFNDARRRLASFIGADVEQVAFTANTTAATNLVALAWGEWNIGAEDLIVCCQADHHANLMPFLMLAQRKGARIEHIPFDATGRLDQAAYEALLEQRPKLVCLAQVGNVFGIEAPVQAMSAAAHAAGARVLVDAAQSFPHRRINVAELGADWIAFSAHKAYGPFGIGALWISPGAFAEMDPLGGGGGVISHIAEQSYYLRPSALQYEPGTPPISQAIGWAAAIDYLDEVGMDNVARHAAALTRYAARGLQRIDGVNVIGDHLHPDGQNGLVSFTVRSVAPGDTARFLGRLGVAIRSGGHCALPLHAALGMIGTGRISIGIHTTRDDIDAALTAIALCRQAHES